MFVNFETWAFCLSPHRHNGMHWLLLKPGPHSYLFIQAAVTQHEETSGTHGPRERPLPSHNAAASGDDPAGELMLWKTWDLKNKINTCFLIIVCYYARPMVNFNKTQTVRIIQFHHTKIWDCCFFQMLSFLIMNKNVYLHSYSVYYYCHLKLVKCAFLRDKKSTIFNVAACAANCVEDMNRS